MMSNINEVKVSFEKYSAIFIFRKCSFIFLHLKSVTSFFTVSVPKYIYFILQNIEDPNTCKNYVVISYKGVFF